MGQAPSVIREAIKQRSPRVIVKLVRASRQCHLAAELGSVDLLMVLVRTYSAAAHLHRGVDERVFELRGTSQSLFKQKAQMMSGYHIAKPIEFEPRSVDLVLVKPINVICCATL